MRQRHVKDIEARLEALSSYQISDPMALRGNWKSQHAQGNVPIYLELGCGKGQFLVHKAQAFPEALYIGVEGNMSVLLRAIEKVGDSGLQNIRFVASYVNDILTWFDYAELSGIYLNFSDPWPKKRHAKRRLTHRTRLEGYLDVLTPGGFLEFKTDNPVLYDFTLQELQAMGIKPEIFIQDLHQSQHPARAFKTEYEEKFSSWGKSIYFVRIRKESTP